MRRPSGDGHGKPADLAGIPRAADLPFVTPNLVGYSGDGYGSGRPSGDGHGRLPVSEMAPVATRAALPPWMLQPSGDGESPLPLTALASAEELRLVGYPLPAGATLKPAARTPKNELWKLLTLVTLFVIWISAASTLLFLYMDRYLFPG